MDWPAAATVMTTIFTVGSGIILLFLKRNKSESNGQPTNIVAQLATLTANQKNHFHSLENFKSEVKTDMDNLNKKMDGLKDIIIEKGIK